ncbi:hypothetical protein F441_04669 [Phytophthora nicotianae CJ01A1]|uniref:UvrD-like helicase C-terminal domain-containing protein n=4 Tax=Phytophthora nicotianae TaxID=4792 RepID=V9FMU0_PHYNI|nr:hypothetical protein F443_04683 [Phytophthora nicotianae P1569]ETK91983.1 hypothetical protein L915_04561 [Phytophthora nicotianae]ETP21917.1 hypothetical protein F441_04669 [Phytophthora nicotianae CJ01A1]ETP49816.1 hypothetical protein F442_04736 [Phytophthora nicotianae P10297]ETL45381.1 hypothetical protein L916_04517 [Phytophthora nicotianae]
MTVHKVQGETCERVVFHTNSIPNVIFAYVALSRIKHRRFIVITHPLALKDLTASALHVAAFENEEKRVNAAVSRTAKAALETISAMKIAALTHNRGNAPR